MATIALVGADTITTGVGDIVLVTASVDTGARPTFYSPDNGRRLAAEPDDLGNWTAGWATSRVGEFAIRIEAFDAAPVVVVVTVTGDGPPAPDYYGTPLLDQAYGARDAAVGARNAAQTARAGAETAKAGAEAAKAGAETAQSAAEDAATQAALIAIGDADAALAGAIADDNSLSGVALAEKVDTPTGYDVIVLAGQSNMSGRGTPFSAVSDPVDPVIFQLKGKAPSKGTVIPAAEPLDMLDTPTGIGPGLQFARRYVAEGLNRGRPVLLVPVAQGGVPIVRTGTPTWNTTVSGSLYANAQAQIIDALTEGDDTTRVVAILWAHGETDGDLNVTGDQYQAQLDLLATGLRTAAGNPAVPFIVTGMVPEYLSTGTRAAVDIVMAATPTRLAHAAFVPGPYDAHLGDGNHYTAQGARLLAADTFAAYLKVRAGLRYVTRYTGRPPLVDDVGVPAHRAHGMRLLVAGYAGACIKAERSDGVTLDVGFFRGWLNVAALLAFSQGLDVRVRTYYDQSGNGRDFEQTTYANQAAIVRAGRLIEHNGIPMPTGDGVNTFYYRTGVGLFAAGAASLLTVIKSGVTGVVGGSTSGVLFAETAVSFAPPMYRLLAQSNAGAQIAQYGSRNDGAAFLAITGHFSAVLPFSPFNGMLRQVTQIDTGTEFRKYLDGTLIGTIATGDRTGTVTLDGTSLWGQARSAAIVANRWNGAIPELVTFADDLTDSQRLVGMTSQRLAYDAI